ncbi:MAG: GrpB family protein [Alphaproteobacteria bacterium]|nr:GrpB family protein [Alphaproteobacteria bacterium]
MAKKLEEMTLAELWRLFPINLVAHNPQWPCWYAEKKDELKELFRSYSVDVYRIEHIGSTAVPDIFAKPIIDILIEFDSSREMQKAKTVLVSAGYRCMSEKENRISLNDGYTEQGFAERVFHLHLRLRGDCDEIAFRDYLRSHSDVAAEYERLKQDLAERYQFDRDAYTEAKTLFVRKYTCLAKV